MLSISVEKIISAYDAEYATLAMHHGVPLITEDQQLLAKFPDQAYSLRDYR